MHVANPNGLLDLASIERIPYVRNSDARLLTLDHYHAAAEKYRLLAHRVQRARRAKPIQTVLVTSPIPGDGKSTVAVNLAHVLVRNGLRVLLLDADLRASDLPGVVGLPPYQPGLSEVLAGQIGLEQAMRCIEPMSLYFLGAGCPPPDPVPLFESDAFKSVLSAVRRSFEWIVIDSTPLTPVADAHCLAALCDSILLVVRWGMTPRDELAQAIATLAGLPLLGLVVNGFEEPRTKTYYSYYQRTGPAPVVLALPPAGPDPQP